MVLARLFRRGRRVRLCVVLVSCSPVVLLLLCRSIQRGLFRGLVRLRGNRQSRDQSRVITLGLSLILLQLRNLVLEVLIHKRNVRSTLVRLEPPERLLDRVPKADLLLAIVHSFPVLVRDRTERLEPLAQSVRP